MSVLVPVRFPLAEHSDDTLRRAVAMAEADGDELVVLHVDLFQDPKHVTRGDLEHAVGDVVDGLDATYVVREAFLVEQAILEEAANQGADTIVIGASEVGRLRRTVRRLSGNDPDIEGYLRAHLDVAIEVVD